MNPTQLDKVELACALYNEGVTNLQQLESEVYQANCRDICFDYALYFDDNHAYIITNQQATR